MTLYKVSGRIGMGIVYAISRDDAEAYMEREEGAAHGPYSVSVASDEDVSWFRNMGGADEAHTSWTAKAWAVKERREKKQ